MFAAALAIACALGVVAGWASHQGSARPAAARAASSAAARPDPETALAALTRPMTATAADPLYMLVNGIRGEVTDKGHSGWISINGYNTSLSITTSQTGTGVGKAQFGPFQVTIPYSLAIPPLMHAVATGRVLGTVEIQASAVAGGASYLTIKLANAQATSIKESASSGRPTDVLTLTAAGVSVNYIAVNGATSTFCFNFATAQSC